MACPQLPLSHLLRRVSTSQAVQTLNFSTFTSLPDSSLNKLNSHCEGSQVTVPCKPSNHGNQQCLPLQLGRAVSLQGSLTFDPARHARRAVLRDFQSIYSSVCTSGSPRQSSVSTQSACLTLSQFPSPHCSRSRHHTLCLMSHTLGMKYQGLKK